MDELVRTVKMRRLQACRAELADMEARHDCMSKRRREQKLKQDISRLEFELGQYTLTELGREIARHN